MQLTLQIDKMQNIYDLLALCCAYIFNEAENEPYDFMAFDDNLYEDVQDSIVKYSIDKEDIGESKAFLELKDFVLHFMGGNSTIEKCYAIVKYIDEKIDYEFRYDIVNRKDILEYDGINGQCKDKVRILLKNVRSFVDQGNVAYIEVTKDKYNLLRDTHDCPCSKLDQVTKRYMIWDERTIKKYPTRVYRFKESHYINRHFEGRNKLVFAIVPFTDENIRNILEEKRVNQAFYIEEMQQDAQDRLKRKYRLAYEGVVGKDVDFLVYPEMLMTDEIRMGCCFNNDGPKLVINGSASRNKVNKSVICSQDGKELFCYCKKNPYKYKDSGTEYTEWLDPKENQEYGVLEIPELGRVSIAICKDLWSEEVKMFHKMIQTNILIVPAFTASGDLESSARNLSEEYNCIVLLANSCAALADKQQGKKIGFVTLPAKIRGQRKPVVKYYMIGACRKECSRICRGRLITIEFVRESFDERVLGYRIKCNMMN